tara:strand:- start:1310 stop:1591 length:282 start_codon:yes stop_codon:yes gene_type:complete
MKNDEVRHGNKYCEGPGEVTVASPEDEEPGTDLREYAEVVEDTITEESVAISKNATKTSLVLAEGIDRLKDKVTSELMKRQSLSRRIEDFIER